jgi:hypothetical protein
MFGAIGEIRGGVRPVVGGGCEEFGGGVVGLMRRCWSGEGGDRPTFVEVVEELGEYRSAVLEKLQNASETDSGVRML